MSRALDTHACNAYCVEQEHCDVVYSGARDAYSGEPQALHPEAARHYIAVDYWREGALVTRIEPATEAPPLETIPPERRHILSAAPEGQVDELRFLVWFRARRPGDKPPWKRLGYKMGEIVDPP